DREDEAGGALRVLLEADVEPDRRVEGRHLVEQDVGELVLERVGVGRRGEVAALAAPGGDRAGYAPDHLLDGVLALLGAELPAEVLLGDDVGGVLRPGHRELDAALLERGVRRVADHGIADLPLDRIERMHTGLGELALKPHATTDLARVGSGGGDVRHGVSPSVLRAYKPPFFGGR